MARPNRTSYAERVSDAVKKLLEEILALPESERRWLSDALLDSMDPHNEEIRAAWNAAALERLRELEAGDELVPHDEALRRAHAILDE